MPDQSPFKLLDAYTKEDMHIFFGRDAEVKELYSMVFQSNLTLVYGQSGTGKTSLVQCGLANRFSETDWFDVYIRRNQNLNSSLLSVLQSKTIHRHSSSSGLKQRLLRRRQKSERKPNQETKEVSLSPLLQTLQSIYKHNLKPVYLIFDQFEELYILGNEAEQMRFYKSINEILQHAPYCRILIIMREELIAELYGFEKEVPGLFDKRLRVEAMSPSKLGDVIEKTTANYGIEMAEEEVIPMIIQAIRGNQRFVELTYLQIFLDKLYREANSDNGRIIIDKALVQKCGNIEDVLKEFLDQQSEEIQIELSQSYPGVPTSAVRKVLNSFVTLAGTKKPINVPELRVAKLQDVHIDFCLKRLLSRRILRPLDDDVFELAHDTLAQRIADQRSSKENTLLEIAKLVRDRYQVYATSKTTLNANELQLVSNYESKLKDEEALTDEQWIFVKKSRQEHVRKRRLLAGIIVSVITVLAFISYDSMKQSQNARINFLRFVEAQFDKHIETSINLINSENFIEAISELDEAITLQEDNLELNVSKADSLKNNATKKAVDKSKFEPLIIEGDSFASAKDYLTASDRYLTALDINYKNDLVKEQISKIAGPLYNTYKNLQGRGDTFFNANQFDIAETEYQDALVALEKYQKLLAVLDDKGQEIRISKINESKLKDKIKSCLN